MAEPQEVVYGHIEIRKILQAADDARTLELDDPKLVSRAAGYFLTEIFKRLLFGGSLGLKGTGRIDFEDGSFAFGDPYL